MNKEATEKEFEIQAPWGQIRGVSWGVRRDTPVLLVHGKLDVCTGFRPLARLLPARFYYVAVDVPGNGRSDPLPSGVRYTVLDLVPTIKIVMDHFGWKKFIYIGHSQGALIGKYFNIAFPGHISRVVELDPVPAHHNWSLTREGLQDWYHRYYHSYEKDSYAKTHGTSATAPKYTYEKAQELLMKSRKLTRDASQHILERCLQPTGDGLYRFTYDQRMKDVTVLPFTGAILEKIYTSSNTPTFAVIAQGEMDRGAYRNVSFVTNPQAWAHDNYQCLVVSGTHDLHIQNPELIAEHICTFLMEGYKAKL